MRLQSTGGVMSEVCMKGCGGGVQRWGWGVELRKEDVRELRLREILRMKVTSIKVRNFDFLNKKEEEEKKAALQQRRCQ